jgi:hypothetical protein
MPLNAILYRAIVDGFHRNVRAVEAYDAQLRGEMGIPNTFEIEQITDGDIDRMLERVHKGGEEQPCVVCVLSALNPVAQPAGGARLREGAGGVS